LTMATSGMSTHYRNQLNCLLFLAIFKPQELSQWGNTQRTAAR